MATKEKDRHMSNAAFFIQATCIFLFMFIYFSALAIKKKLTL